MPVTDEQVRALWDEIKKRVKAQDINRPLWRALDCAVPITVDHRTLVVGLASEHQHEASIFDVRDNKALLDKICGSVATKPLEMLVIDGTTAADYAQWKQLREAAEQRRQQTLERAAQREDEAGEGPGEDDDQAEAGSVVRLLVQYNREMHLLYRSQRQRSQATVRGRFVLQALEQLYQVEQKLAGMEGSDELKDRQLSRSLEHVASMIDVPATVLAIEYARLKQAKS